MDDRPGSSGRTAERELMRNSIGTKIKGVFSELADRGHSVFRVVKAWICVGVHVGRHIRQQDALAWNLCGQVAVKSLWPDATRYWRFYGRPFCLGSIALRYPPLPYIVRVNCQ